MSEVSVLSNAHLKCREIWAALQLADYKKEGVLNDVAISVLYESQKSLFQELLIVRSAEELQALLDEDEDGFLSADEQVAIFSLIKERMQLCAEELCACHEYTAYKEMMQGVRLLEGEVLQYQEMLRRREHVKELEAYKESGEAKLQRFDSEWNSKFSLFHKDAQAKLSALQATHSLQTHHLNEQLSRDIEVLRHKPRAILRDLQTQEILVAVHERYTEAQQIRNELKSLEGKEQSRVEGKVLEEQEQKRVKLRKQQEKEVKELKLKIETAMYGLRIRKDQQFRRLQKEIKLYLNDIHRSHNSAIHFARKLGETRDELRRTKKKSRILKQLVSEMRISHRAKVLLADNTLQAAPQHGSVIGTGQGRAKTSSPLKRGMQEITRFNIGGKGGEVKRGGAALLRKQLAQVHIGMEKTHLRSITTLYDERLTPLAGRDESMVGDRSLPALGTDTWAGQ